MAPRRPRRRSGNPTASIAGAAEPGSTSVSVTVSRLGVSGRVKGAVSGYVHVTVQRKRGKGWVTVRRVKPTIAKRGRFEGAIARLARGTYRVAARFEGTGTAHPSRSRVPHPPPVKGARPLNDYLGSAPCFAIPRPLLTGQAPS